MWQDLKPNDRRALLRAIVARVQVFADRIDIVVDRAHLAQWLLGDIGDTKRAVEPSPEAQGHFLTLTVPARLRRAGKEMRIVVGDGSDPTAPDDRTVETILKEDR